MALLEKCQAGLHYHCLPGGAPFTSGQGPLQCGLSSTCKAFWLTWLSNWGLGHVSLPTLWLNENNSQDYTNWRKNVLPPQKDCYVSSVSDGNRTSKWSQIQSSENNNTLCDLEVWRFMLAPTGMLMCKESGLSSQTLTNTSHFLLIGFNLTSILLSPEEYFILEYLDYVDYSLMSHKLVNEEQIASTWYPPSPTHPLTTTTTQD